MYTPTQLEVIRAFGSKELTEGCLIGSKQFHIYEQEIVYTPMIWGTWFHKQWNTNLKKFRVHCPLTEEDIWFDFEDITNYQILWHIPILEDVFRLAKNKWFTIDLSSRSEHFLHSMRFYYWNKYRDYWDINYTPSIPLLEQTESVLIELLTIFK